MKKLKFFEKLLTTNNNLKSSLLIICILSLFSVIFQIIMQNGAPTEDFKNYLIYIQSPLLILFNFLPIFLLTVFFYFLLNSISKSFFVINLPFLMILIINHYKIFFRDIPLTITDFSLAQEAISILQNYTIEFNLRVFILSLLMIIIFIFLFKYIHAQKNNKEIRLIGIFSTVLLIFLSYLFIYSNKELYINVHTSTNEYYDVNIVTEKGLIYSLLSKNTLTTLYEKPTNYSTEKIQELMQSYASKNTSNKRMPNVIAIMSEAFFYPENAENLEFYENKNPLKNFDRLKENSYYGNIIVPGFAGATASTEFEFLTGMNIFTIDSSMPDVYKTHINSKIYSLVSIFNNLGYNTLAIHPGHSWFYNRTSVYKYMGFDNMIFASDLPKNVEKVNYYISDNVTADLIIDNYKKHLETSPDKGYFNFTVTIQNHGPYIDKQTDKDPIVIRPENMDEKLYNIVNNYMIGLNDADNLLGKVTDFANTLDTPTVIVFFGDHLPYFDSELQGYKDIGYPITDNSLESLKLKHTTPYIIWGNDKAKELINLQGGTIITGQGKDISSNYLGLELLKYINMDLPPFFNFIDALKEKINIITQNYYYIENKFYTQLPEEFEGLINDYKIWEYYNLKEQK